MTAQEISTILRHVQSMTDMAISVVGQAVVSTTDGKGGGDSRACQFNVTNHWVLTV